MGDGWSDDAVMRELHRMSMIIDRKARSSDNPVSSAEFLLSVLATHERERAAGVAPFERDLVQAELAEAIGVQPQSVGTLLSRMEREGLIVRASSEFDRRAISVALTDAGRAGAQKGLEAQRRFAEETLSVLSESEKQTLGEVARKIIGGLVARERQGV